MILLMDDDVGGITTAIETQIALESAVGMFSVDVNQQIGAVRGNQVTIGAFEPAFAHVGRSLPVYIVVVDQVLRHHHTAIGGESAGA